MNDLEASELISARIIARLAPMGVNRITLTLRQLDPDGNMPFSERLFIDAMYWLEEEGILRFEMEKHQNHVRMRGCVLSAQGFSMLSQPFSLDGKTTTVGDTIKSVEDNGAGYSNVGNFVGGLLAAFTKSIS